MSAARLGLTTCPRARLQGLSSLSPSPCNAVSDCCARRAPTRKATHVRLIQSRARCDVSESTKRRRRPSRASQPHGTESSLGRLSQQRELWLPRHHHHAPRVEPESAPSAMLSPSPPARRHPRMPACCMMPRVRPHHDFSSRCGQVHIREERESHTSAAGPGPCAHGHHDAPVDGLDSTSARSVVAGGSPSRPE